MSTRKTFGAQFFSAHGALLAVFALVALGLGFGWFGLRGKVEAQASVIEQLDHENELQFQNDVRTAEALRHMHEEIREQRMDFRAAQAGRRLPPLEEHDFEIEIAAPAPRRTPAPRSRPAGAPTP